MRPESQIDNVAAASHPDSPAAPLPSLVIVGRPNVGKSTLFNRPSRVPAAPSPTKPGITRDRIYGEAQARPPV